MSDDLDAATDRREIVRCQGCGAPEIPEKLIEKRVANSRFVRYCPHCEALRSQYNIPAEGHEQYCLPQLADELTESDGDWYDQ